MDLKWSLFTKDIRPHPQLRVKLQQKVQKLESYLEHFPSDGLHLKVSMEKHQKKKWFRVALALKVPTGSLRVQKFGDDPISIFDQAVKAMLRELSRTKAAIRNEQDWADVSETGFEPALVAFTKPLAPVAPGAPPPPE